MLRFFESIHIKIPQEEIYKRLGYRNKITEISAAEDKKFKDYILDGMLLLNLKATVLRLPIKRKTASGVSFEGGIFFRSKLLLSLLIDCNEALCMGVTASDRILKEIKKLEEKDFSRAVVYDALASEMVDFCFDWLLNLFSQELIRENKELTKKRISPGYGDFSIEYQKIMYDILQLHKIGVNITKKYMLIPEKSAIAVSGIKVKKNER